MILKDIKDFSLILYCILKNELSLQVKYINIKVMDINKFLKELRDSSERIYSIYTKGSCYRLFSILSTIFPNAVPYWSDMDNHAITKIDNKFYDIGGEITLSYVEDKGYYPIPKRLRNGYYLLKYAEDEKLGNSIPPEKYR